MYKVLLKTSAQKELDALPAQARKKAAMAIDDLVHMGIHAKHTKKLQPPIDGYRMRVGEYRILFDRNEEIIVIHHISKRADAY
ncbi:type II toxin-antitoxin system RelE/ParE family toxin [Candidatus Kaiserbacteria bacterium]|nr:type II toxin-antitoxin system RelE/ParE family toxin [Candidatus Kaiserbacteria bacterium]